MLEEDGVKTILLIELKCETSLIIILSWCGNIKTKIILNETNNVTKNNNIIQASVVLN